MSLIEASILTVIFAWAIYMVFKFFKKSSQGKCSGCDSPGSCGSPVDRNEYLTKTK